jgi:predicted amidohydrolase
MTSNVKVAAVQMNSGPDVARNLALAGRLLAQARDRGVALAVLPENFPIIGARKEDKLECAESLGRGPIQEFLIDAARVNELWIVAGSIPLRSEVADRCYGASLVIDPDGGIEACYRKIHLYDISVPGRDESYRESASLKAGEELVVQDTPAGCLGLSICYDLRFPELYRKLVAMGATLFSVPSAFTQATGEAHWHALLRARAIENLAYVIAPGQYGKHADGRATYGHSMIVDPCGRVVAEEAEGDCVITADVDLDVQQEIRRDFPALEHRVLE